MEKHTFCHLLWKTILEVSQFDYYSEIFFNILSLKICLGQIEHEENN